MDGHEKFVDPSAITRSLLTPKSLQTSPSRRSRTESDESHSQQSLSPKSSTKRKSSSHRVCGVCGDRAKSFHFGGLSCDSCKAFFRRSVQNDGYLSFSCAYDGKCQVTMGTRKSCQKCRFDKCIKIGMEVSWVMSEEERSALNSQRLEKKQQLKGKPKGPSSQSSCEGHSPAGKVSCASSPTAVPEYTPKVEDMLRFMTEEERDTIHGIVNYYRASYKEIPYRVQQDTAGPRNPLEIVEMFTTILRRFAYFSKLVPEFSELGRDDQGNLLRASVLEMCLLRGALSFDIQNQRWPNSNMELLQNCPKLRVKDMEKLVSKELYELHINFIFRIQKMKVDEPTIMLLLLVVLFYPERSVVEDVVRVNQAQEKYLILLEKYVGWRYGPRQGPRLFPQLLTKLSDLRQLNDLHTEYNLKLNHSEVDVIRRGLTELKLNPYPQWEIVPVSDADGGRNPADMDQSPQFPPVPPPFTPPLEVQHPSTERGKRHPFAEAFLNKMPALLDNHWAPLFSQDEMSMAQEVMRNMGNPNAAFNIQYPSMDTGVEGGGMPNEIQQTAQGRAYVGNPPGQPYGGNPPGQPYGGNPPGQPYGGNPPGQPYGGNPPGQPYRGNPPAQAAGSDADLNQSIAESFGLDADFIKQMRARFSPEERAKLRTMVTTPPSLGASSTNPTFSLGNVTPELISSFWAGGTNPFVGGSPGGHQGSQTNPTLGQSQRGPNDWPIAMGRPSVGGGGHGGHGGNNPTLSGEEIREEPLQSYKNSFSPSLTFELD